MPQIEHATNVRTKVSQKTVIVIDDDNEETEIACRRLLFPARPQAVLKNTANKQDRLAECQPRKFTEYVDLTTEEDASEEQKHGDDYNHHNNQDREQNAGRGGIPVRKLIKYVDLTTEEESNHDNSKDSLVPSHSVSEDPKSSSRVTEEDVSRLVRTCCISNRTQAGSSPRRFVQPDLEDCEPEAVAQWGTLLVHIVDSAALYQGGGVLGARKSSPPTERVIGDNNNTNSYSYDSIFGRFFKGEPPVLIGAAGELFIYEVLSKWLPNFTMANWTSGIRNQVRVHPAYSEIEPWTGDDIETADFEYDDADGILTERLDQLQRARDRRVRGSFSHPSRLTGERTREPLPRMKYYLEVKTTTGNPGDRLIYMSPRQWDKMKLCSATTKEQENNSTYVILRVHNIFSGAIDVEVYIDPVRCAADGALKFQMDEDKTPSPRPPRTTREGGGSNTDANNDYNTKKRKIPGDFEDQEGGGPRKRWDTENIWSRVRNDGQQQVRKAL